MGITQLILDVGGLNVALPEVSFGKYTAQFTPLSEDVDMISGRRVRELRGNVWVLGYQYNYFKPAMKDLVIEACEKGKRTPITCAFLKQNRGTVLDTSRFWITKFTYPKFYWSKHSHGELVPLWGDFSLTLREVKPGD